MRPLAVKIVERTRSLQQLFFQGECNKNAYSLDTHSLAFRFVFMIVFLLNLFLLVAGSSGAVPFCILFLPFGLVRP